MTPSHGPRGQLGRRAALVALGAFVTSCARCAERAPVTGAWRDAYFEPDADAPEGQRALVFSPAPRLPVLVALHGRGEAGRGLTVGAHAWRDDYGIERLHARCLAPPLRSDDVFGLARPERIGHLNDSLSATPYRGLTIACPYTPDLPDHSAAGAAGFGRFVVERLLKQAREWGNSAVDRAATGIDGVSMGGRLALLVGLTHPETFGAIGALQPAIRPDEASLFADLARDAVTKAAAQGGELALRLVSSEADPFLGAVQALAAELRQRGVQHEMLITPGPHDYIWNRGPGGLEMLLWHERVERRIAPP